MLVLVGVGRAGRELVLGAWAGEAPEPPGLRRFALDDGPVRAQAVGELLRDAAAVVVAANEASPAAALVTSIAQAMGALVLVTDPALGVDILGEPADATPLGSVVVQFSGGRMVLAGVELFGVGPWPAWLNGGPVELVVGPNGAPDADFDLTGASALHLQLVGPVVPFSRVAYRMSRLVSALPPAAHVAWSWWVDPSPRAPIRVAAMIERKSLPAEPEPHASGLVLPFPRNSPPREAADRHGERLTVLARRCDRAVAELERRFTDPAAVRRSAADLAAAGCLLAWEVAARTHGPHRVRSEAVFNGVSALVEGMDRSDGSFSSRAQLAICAGLATDTLGRALTSWLREIDAPELRPAMASAGASRVGRGGVAVGAGSSSPPSELVRRPLLELLHARPTAHRMMGPQRVAHVDPDPLAGVREEVRWASVESLLIEPRPSAPSEPPLSPGPSLFRRPVVAGVAAIRWPDGARIDRLVTREQLRQEGESMSHCVGGMLREGRAAGGGRYWVEVRDGLAAVFSYRDGRGIPQATFDILVGLRLLRQLLGRRNAGLEAGRVRARCDWAISALGVRRRWSVDGPDGARRFVVPRIVGLRPGSDPWDELVAVTEATGIVFEDVGDPANVLRVAVGPKEVNERPWGDALGPLPADGGRLELVFDGATWRTTSRPDEAAERPLDLLRRLGVVLDPAEHIRMLGRYSGALDGAFSTFEAVLAPDT